MDDPTCLFCAHRLDGRSKKFCTTCLPPYGEWQDKREYQRRYQILWCAIGHGTTGMEKCRIPKGHPARPKKTPPRRQPAACDHTCLECGCAFRSKSATARLCSDRCRKTRRARTTQASRPSRAKPPRPCAQCGTPVPARRTRCHGCQPPSTSPRPHHLGQPCSNCGSPLDGASKRYCTSCWPTKAEVPDDTERRRLHNRLSRKTRQPSVQAARRRRRLRAAADHEPYDRLDIAERDGWTCGLCGRPIDPSLQYPDPWSFSVDHIIPLSLDGDDTGANAQAAHLHCNVSKGNRCDDTIQLRLIG